jgi:hypothetical protein
VGAEGISYGQWAYASGGYDAPGQAQASLYVLRGTTDHDHLTHLFLDGASEHIQVPPGRAATFDILVVGRSPDSGAVPPRYGFYRIVGGVLNDSGTMHVYVDDPDYVIAESDSLLDVGLDTGANTLRVWALGLANTSIRWVATVRTAEVAW